MYQILRFLFAILLVDISRLQVDNNNIFNLGDCIRLPETLNVGGLFEKGEENLRQAFYAAINRVNNDQKKLLPNTKLVAITETLDKSDSFAASRKVCRILQNNLVAIFGPQSPKSSNYVRSICSILQMPHFESRSDSSLAQPLAYSINLAPKTSTLGRALRDLVMKKNWKTFAILYSDDSSMILIQEILKSPNMHTKHIIVRKARQKSDEKSDYRLRDSNIAPLPSFKEILKELFKLNVKNIIMDIPGDQVAGVLNQADDVNMLRVYNSYIFTTLDLHTVDLEQFYQTGTNISAFSLMSAKQLQLYENILSEYSPTTPSTDDFSSRDQFSDSSRTIVKKTTIQLADGSAEVSVGRNLSTEAALIFDGVELLAKALRQLSITELNGTDYDIGASLNFPLASNCAPKGDHSINQIQPWPMGSLLKNYMQLMKFQGLTGDIRLHDKGYRSDFNLQLHDLTRDGLKLVAQWTTTGGLNYVGNYSSVLSENYRELLKNKTLTIIMLENKPYVMKVDGYQTKTGNDKYEGYCIDLVKELASIWNFKYHFKVFEGEGVAHGSRNEKGEWNGLIKELMDGRADIAVGDLTITFERESVVDFTMPFMSLGIGILVKKPTKASPKLFEFMLPLAPEVWIYLITAFVGVTLFLFMVARFSPYEWQNPHPCEQDADELCNDFTMKNTLWFTIGCLMQQGCDVMPRASSTRLMSATWWFFILILVSSYTANLAAFLTVERMDNPIQNADDLAKQTKVLYGCLKTGSTRNFFQQSNFTTYARMWSFMESKRSETLLESNTKGVERVKKGDFAFLMESTTIEYTVERNCDLSQVGSLLDQKGYGIATQQDSPYRAVLSEAILNLQEQGVLHRLKDRWWKEKKEGNITCEVREAQKSSGTASELGLDHVGGVFVVLGAGAMIAIAICILEFYWKHIMTPRQERNHLATQLMQEFKNIFLSGNKRPLRTHRNF